MYTLYEIEKEWSSCFSYNSWHVEIAVCRGKNYTLTKLHSN